MSTETVSGEIERITYFNPDNGYCVLKIYPTSKFNPDAEAPDGTVTVVGSLTEFNVGEAVEFSGQWVHDSRYGLQFKAESFTPTTPASLQGLKRFLSSDLFEGVGTRTAERIVEYFGMETLEVLNNDPQRIHEVPELKTKTANNLIKAWAENQAVRQVMIFLQGLGISSRFARRIHERYGDDTVHMVTENPYRLADDVFGIGFLKADTIAQSMGVRRDAPIRLRSGLHYALNHLANDGHTYSPRDKLVETAMELLRVNDAELIEQALNDELLAGLLVRDVIHEGDESTHAIYLPMYHNAERRAAMRLKMIANAPSAFERAVSEIDWYSFLAELAEDNDVALTQQQQSAVQAALTTKVSVLTGGPGTGKTTTLQMVINALSEIDARFELASPTGRAAKRLSEATGEQARTIHRMLGYGGEGFQRDEDYPLDTDMVIIDEASMIDLLLFYQLLKAIPPRTHLMLVGDVDQLPSVGAGNVLKDVINSGIAHVTRLNTIFRQDENSRIVVNAHRVNQGQMPEIDNQSSDFFFFRQEDPQSAADLLIDIVRNRVPEKFGYDPMDEIQVIAPMYRGPIGVNMLNDRLQRALNGDTRMAEKKLNGRVFRVGDKVMQTKNNYDKDVFNGDIGRIHAIDFEDNLLEVAMDTGFVFYEWSEVDQLTHAYCISTHRSQGSEYPVVVMPVMTQHYMMLQRNLLYTAITRAKKLVVLVGTDKAVHIAVNNNKVNERYSGLLARLRG